MHIPEVSVGDLVSKLIPKNYPKLCLPFRLIILASLLSLAAVINNPANISLPLFSEKLLHSCGRCLTKPKQVVI